MKAVFLFVILILSSFAYGQKMFENQSTVCPLKFVMEDNEVLIAYEPNDSILINDFLKGLEINQIEKLNGVIMIQVMVDTVNQICCVSFANNTNLSDKKLGIPNRIKKMPGWKRSEGIMENENICALLNLIFYENEIIVSRIGYNRNKGKNQLNKTTFKRKKEPLIQDTLPMPTN